jgi:hypothetical protein
LHGGGRRPHPSDEAQGSFSIARRYSRNRPMLNNPFLNSVVWDIMWPVSLATQPP